MTAWDEFIFVARTPVEEGSSVPTLVTLDPMPGRIPVHATVAVGKWCGLR